MNTTLQRYFRNFLVINLLFLSACENTSDDNTETGCPSDSFDSAIHYTLGNPSDAQANVNRPTNFLIALPQYALSYNRDKGIPNWVSWHLTSDWLGNIDRQDDFRAYTLPSGWFSPDHSSYTGSGFDRGHNCPSGDRTCSVSNNSSTFYMTNMIPQAAGLNRGPWSSLEDYCRKLANEGNELYIIMGNYGRGGTGTNGYKETISSGRIVVPEAVYKIIVVLPKGDNDITRIGSSTRVIAVNMPNTSTVENSNWGTFRTKVDVIEQETGYNFFTALSTGLQNDLENNIDTGPTQ